MAYNVLVFQPYCPSCFSPIGNRQYEYEKLFEEIYNQYENKPLNIIQAITIEKMGLSRMCCKLLIFTAPQRFVKDIISEAMIVDTKRDVVRQPSHKYLKHIPYEIIRK